jgi:putative transposase
MSRAPRVTLPGVPHHVTQRGTRRLTVFSSPDDYRAYLGYLAHRAALRGLSVWCYCLLPNHVHLIVAPGDGKALSRALGEAHRQFAGRVHRREGWCGHLWQQRFYSCPLDERHLVNAVRYVLLNPVRAGLVGSVRDWPHSSYRAHTGVGERGLLDLEPLARRIPDWEEFLRIPADEEETVNLRVATRRGRWR